MALRGIDNRDKPAHVACYTQYRVALRLRVSRVRNKDAAARKSLETEEAQFIQRERRMCVFQLADNDRITHPGKKWWREF